MFIHRERPMGKTIGERDHTRERLATFKLQSQGDLVLSKYAEDSI